MSGLFHSGSENGPTSEWSEFDDLRISSTVRSIHKRYILGSYDAASPTARLQVHLLLLGTPYRLLYAGLTSRQQGSRVDDRCYFELLGADVFTLYVSPTTVMGAG